MLCNVLFHMPKSVITPLAIPYRMVYTKASMLYSMLHSIDAHGQLVVPFDSWGKGGTICYAQFVMHGFFCYAQFFIT